MLNNIFKTISHIYKFILISFVNKFKISNSQFFVFSLKIKKIGTARTQSHSHKLCARVSSFEEIAALSEVYSAMTKPRSGSVVFLIAITATPSKYELLDDKHIYLFLVRLHSRQFHFFNFSLFLSCLYIFIYTIHARTYSQIFIMHVLIYIEISALQETSLFQQFAIFSFFGLLI